MKRSCTKIDLDKRKKWRSRRSTLEAYYYHTAKYRMRRFVEWALFKTGKRFFFDSFRKLPFYDRGFQNARRIRLNRISIHVSYLPPAFDSYRILHLTDLHLDSLVGVEDSMGDLIRGISYDVCLFSGDYTREMAGSFDHILPRMRKIVDAMHPRDGVFGTLGNHDTHRMLESLEAMGISMLINETVCIVRGGDQIAVTGVDDPHLYRTDPVENALRTPKGPFKIALVHSPELFDVAAENGYHLYLCGHTHGGQICLPGGIPLVTHLKQGQQFYRGLWNYGPMMGYTNQGAGVVSLPLRYNTQSEIALITLKSGTTRHPTGKRNPHGK